MKEQKTRNLTFSYLQALAILMVIDDHTDSSIGIMSGIFPYDSFFMPMFVFISGYFYKKQTVFKNIEHKFFRLFLPYVVWALITNGIEYLLKMGDIVYWYQSINMDSIYQLVSIRPFSSLNGASWFVIMLIWVSVTYNIIRNLIHFDNKKVDYILLAVSIICGIVSLQLCMQGYNENPLCLPYLRTAFYFQFYHIGFMFKRYWEPYIQNIRTLYLCTVCVLINAALIIIYGNKINFYGTVNMGSFNSCYLPLITSVTGILFWYKMVYFVSLRIGEIKIIDFLSKNTFTIMQVHLFFINIPNFFIFWQIKSGSNLFSDFDVSLFQISVWTRYSPTSKLIGFFLSLIGSLIVAYIIRKIKNCFEKSSLKNIMDTIR